MRHADRVRSVSALLCVLGLFAGSRVEAADVNHEWFFGDGGEATGPTPTHAFNVSGRYPVDLLVDNGALVGIATTVTLAPGDSWDVGAILLQRHGLDLEGQYLIAVIDATDPLQECDESFNTIVVTRFPAR